MNRQKRAASLLIESDTNNVHRLIQLHRKLGRAAESARQGLLGAMLAEGIGHLLFQGRRLAVKKVLRRLWGRVNLP